MKEGGEGRGRGDAIQMVLAWWCMRQDSALSREGVSVFGLSAVDERGIVRPVKGRSIGRAESEGDEVGGGGGGKERGGVK